MFCEKNSFVSCSMIHAPLENHFWASFYVDGYIKNTSNYMPVLFYACESDLTVSLWSPYYMGHMACQFQI